MGQLNYRRVPFVLGAILTALGVVLLFVGYSASQSARDGGGLFLTHQLTPQQRRARDLYWARKRGLQFGVPDYARALEQMREMEPVPRIEAESAAIPGPRGELSTPAATPTPGWTFIGPQPMLNAEANFGGPLFPATPGPLPGSYNATGRVTSIAFDPNSHDLFIGAAGGGLWRSSDFGATFQPLSIPLPARATLSGPANDLGLSVETIGAIAINPATTPSTVYAATGEANNGSDSYYGYGIFQSTDLGGSWTSLNFALFRNAAFTKMAINPGATPTLFAAAGLGFSASRADAGFQITDAERTSGLFRSTDGGTTWMQYPVAAFAVGLSPATPTPTATPSPLPSPVPTFTCHLPGAVDQPCPAEDVAIDPLNPANVYVGIETADVFGSTDGGNTWLPACFSNNIPCTFPNNIDQMDRESVAVGPPSPGAPLACSGGTAPCGTVYAMLGAPDGIEYLGFFKSTDGGASWTAETVPSFLNSVTQTTIDGTSASNFSQSFYDQTLTADPLDATANTVLFGGVGLYESTNSGASWSFLPGNGGTHSDQHALALDTADNNTIFVGNDGGAFKFPLNGIVGGVAPFTSLNQTISAGQIQSIAPDPVNVNKALAGFQDNGTQMFLGTTPLTPSALAWNSVDTADGGFTLIDHTNANSAYHTFASSPSGPELARSTDGGFTWDSADPTSTIVQLMTFDGDLGANFYPPLANDPNVAGRVLFGAHFIYASTDGMLTWQRQETTDLTGGCASDSSGLESNCALQDIEIARSDNTKGWALSIQDPNTDPATPFKLFNTSQANLNSGAIWKDVTANLHFNTARTQATGIAIDPNNAAVAYLSLSGSRAATQIGHVYRTANFGATWTPIDGPFGRNTSLPDAPVLRILVDRTDISGGTLYAASDIGVFRSTDTGAAWSAFDQGTIPAVPVFDIEQDDRNLIFIGTHGRGAFTIVPPPPPPVSLTVNPTSVNFGNALIFGTNGQLLPARVVTLSNPRNSKQNRPVLITGAPQITGAPDFSILSNTCRSGGLILKPGGSCSVKVTFRPQAIGTRPATLTFFDSATNSAQTVALGGKGVQGKASINPLSLNYSPQKVGTPSPPKFVTLRNINPIAMGIQGIGIVGDPLTDFSFTTTCGTRFPTVLLPTHSCTVKVVFTPQTKGPLSAKLQFTDDAVGSPQSVPMGGQGR